MTSNTFGNPPNADDKKYFALREKPKASPYQKGDVLVLFGELFTRGYANGLVEEAERCGMKVVRATVGRRDRDGKLRALNAEELAQVPGPIINVPLEAGFDMEPDSKGVSPVDQLKDIKLSEWENAKIDWNSIEESRKAGIGRFRENVQIFLKELEAHVPAGKNVLFAHLMAGGVPRTKIVMPLMNKVFKGIGERYLSSETFWKSEIGKVCEKSFMEVTAETFRHLVDLSKDFREKRQAQGAHVSYVAYGYHGTEIFHHGAYRWQSYSPYLQGFAKMHLEKLATDFRAQGVATSAYNCPEILTNSTTIFQGVEVPLYALLSALQKDSQSTHIQKVVTDCRELLKDESALPQIQNVIDTFYENKEVQSHCNFAKWPQHSSQEQLQKLIESSDYIVSLHKDEKKLMTAVLSEVVFKSCGYVMLHSSWNPPAPVIWINHDLVAKCF